MRPRALAPPGPGECHLWMVDVRPRAGWLLVLDAAERERAGRFPVTASGAVDVFVTSRAVQRLVGAGYQGTTPEDVVTDRWCAPCRESHGKPRWPGSTLDFSVSHTADWLIMAVTDGARVGADIEGVASLRRADGFDRVALAAAEQRDFAAVAAEDRRAWLTTAWTRKEAAMKLSGLGLAAPPRAIDVSGPTALVTGVPRWPADPVHLREVAAPAGHAAALATTAPLTEVRVFHGVDALAALTPR